MGIGLVLLTGLGAFLWYENRPKPEPEWNRTALKATFDDINVNTGADDVLLYFNYIVENKTSSDYSIKPDDDVAIMAVRAKGKGLMGSSAKIEWPSFIPAKQKVSLTISDKYPYGGQAPKLNKSLKEVPTDNLDQLSAFVAKQLKELDGFTVFDKRNHYQIELPSGWGEDKKTVPLKAQPQQ